VCGGGGGEGGLHICKMKSSQVPWLAKLSTHLANAKKKCNMRLFFDGAALELTEICAPAPYVNSLGPAILISRNLVLKLALPTSVETCKCKTRLLTRLACSLDFL